MVISGRETRVFVLSAPKGPDPPYMVIIARRFRRKTENGTSYFWATTDKVCDYTKVQSFSIEQNVLMLLQYDSQ